MKSSGSPGATIGLSLRAIGVLALVAVSFAGCSTSSRKSTPSVTATPRLGIAAPPGSLYQPPSPLPLESPGTLIWAQRVPGRVVDGSAAVWRLLYHSRTRLGRDIAVSGFALVAESPVPKGGRPVYAWAHGTAGQGDECAPSKDIGNNLPPDASDVISVHGALVATDYDGLGTPGTPTYYDNVAAGRAVLDSVRALSEIPGAGRLGPVVLAGHSQGGTVALFAAQIAQSYARPLDVRGVVAMAPGADLPTLVETHRHTPLARGLILIAAHGLHAAYPGLDPAAFLTPRAVRDLPHVASECVEMTVSHWLRTDPLLPKPIAEGSELRTILEQNSPEEMDPRVPVLIVHGQRDDIVPIAQTARLQARYCAAGAVVSRRLYAGQDHFGPLDAASSDVLQWMSARFAGAAAAPDDCPA